MIKNKIKKFDVREDIQKFVSEENIKKTASRIIKEIYYPLFFIPGTFENFRNKLKLWHGLVSFIGITYLFSHISYWFTQISLISYFVKYVVVLIVSESIIYSVVSFLSTKKLGIGEYLKVFNGFLGASMLFVTIPAFGISYFFFDALLSISSLNDFFIVFIPYYTFILLSSVVEETTEGKTWRKVVAAILCMTILFVLYQMLFQGMI